MKNYQLFSRKVILRLIEEIDLHDLYIWRNSFEFREFCSLRRNEISFTDFKIEFENDTINDRREQFIIEDLNGNKIGTIFLYALTKEHQNAFVTIFIKRGLKNKGYGAIAFAIYLKYVLSKYILHKISVEVYSNNIGVKEMLMKSGFVREGCFKEQRKDSVGNWLDIHRLSLFATNTAKLNEFMRNYKSI